jgi:TnpA family transposase
VLSLLLGQQTQLQPTEIMIDTGAYADIIFGILCLLGYQFSPRIRDIGSARFWRIDRMADYGSLNRIGRQRINTHLIEQEWDDLRRLARSLTLGAFQVESLMRTLQRGDRPTQMLLTSCNAHYQS